MKTPWKQLKRNVSLETKEAPSDSILKQKLPNPDTRAQLVDVHNDFLAACLSWQLQRRASWSIPSGSKIRSGPIEHTYSSSKSFHVSVVASVLLILLTH